MNKLRIIFLAFFSIITLAIGRTMAFSLTVVLFVGTSLLISVPTTSQGQACTFPTEQDVINVANEIFAFIVSGGVPPSVQDLLQVHFTCLARVAQDMYTSATVVANFTFTSSPDSTVEQYQLVCMSGAWTRSTFSNFKDPAALPAMPFAINTNYQCSLCEELTMGMQDSNYDSDSNCVCEYTC